MVGTNSADERTKLTGLAANGYSLSCFGDVVDFDSCIFNKEYFVYTPDAINFANFHSNKCYFSEDRGIWCTTCHGEFENASNLQQIMVTSINFNQMPSESLVYIEKIVTPIDHSNLLVLKEVYNIIEKEKHVIVSLNDSIDGIS
jgi:hypothetical protein